MFFSKCSYNYLADTSDNRDNTHSTLSHYDSDHEDYHDLYDDIDEGCDQTDKVPVPMIGDNQGNYHTHNQITPLLHVDHFLLGLDKTNLVGYR